MDDWYATGVTLRLTVYDSEGKVIGESEHCLGNLAPGDQTPFGIEPIGINGEDVADYRLALIGHRSSEHQLLEAAKIMF